jgi:hypothetical protein
LRPYLVDDFKTPQRGASNLRHPVMKIRCKTPARMFIINDQTFDKRRQPSLTIRNLGQQQIPLSFPMHGSETRHHELTKHTDSFQIVRMHRPSGEVIEYQIGDGSDARRSGKVDDAGVRIGVRGLLHGQATARVAKEVGCALRRQLKLLIDGVVLSRRKVAGRVKQQPQASGTRLRDAINRPQIRRTLRRSAQGAPRSEKTIFVVRNSH